MSRRARTWFPAQWRKVLRVDGSLAEAEGLAAGTGLLTGDLVRGTASATARPSPCPACAGRGEVVVIDLVAQVVSRRCRVCGHRWDLAEAADTSVA